MGVDWFDLNIFNSFYPICFMFFSKNTTLDLIDKSLAPPKVKFNDRGPTRLSHAHQLV